MTCTCVKMTVANQCTWVQNHLFTFLSLVNKDQPVKNSLSTSNIHYLCKCIDFEGVILHKSIQSYDKFYA